MIDWLFESGPGMIIGGFVLGIGATCAALAIVGYLRILIEGPCA